MAVFCASVSELRGRLAADQLAISFQSISQELTIFVGA